MPHPTVEQGFSMPLLCSLGMHGLLLAVLLFLPESVAPLRDGAVTVRIVSPPDKPAQAMPLPRTPHAAARPPAPPARRAVAPSPALPTLSATAAESKQPPADAVADDAAATEPPAAPAESSIGPAPVPVTDAAADERAAAYLSLLRQRIEACRDYPLLARKGRQQGRAVVRFRLDRQGQLIEAWLATATGHRLLDRAALQAVHDAAPFPPPPAECDPADFYDAPLNFVLVQ